MVMGAYARKHSRYHRSVECETDGALQILWNLWELHRFAKVLQICETGVMEKQETQRPNVLADVEEIYEYPKDTSTGVSKDISEKCVLGKWLIEEPYALIGHVRFCEGLLRLEPLIAKQYMMKGCEKVETKSTRRHFMLISYRFKNFCSFAEEAEFDMMAPGNKVKHRFPDNYVKTEEGYDILKTAVVIGENAGGKTNFINSLSFLKSMFEDNKVKHSYRSLININNLQSECPAECETKQEFDISVIGESGTIYHYNLQIDEFCIVQESFSFKQSKTGKEKKIIYAKREHLKQIGDKPSSMAVEFEIKIDNCDKEIQTVFEQTAYNKGAMGLFVSKLAIVGDSHAIEFVNWMNDKLVVESKNYNYYLYKNIQNEEDDLRILKEDRFLEILRMVDYSICGIEIDDEKPFSMTKIIRKTKEGNILSRELRRDSGGVGEFFAWAVQIFRVVYENKMVFADEVDRVLNPILAERMIAFINGKDHKGQFVFSSHNVLHLDLKNYMKEQIYFVTKNRDTLDSELYSLADFPEIKYDTTKIYEFYMKGILGGTAFE